MLDVGKAQPEPLELAGGVEHDGVGTRLNLAAQEGCTEREMRRASDDRFNSGGEVFSGVWVGRRQYEMECWRDDHETSAEAGAAAGGPAHQDNAVVKSL